MLVTAPLALLETEKSRRVSLREVGHLFVQCAPLFGALFLFNLIESMPKFVMEGTLAYKYQLYFNALFFPAQAILLSIGFVYKPQLLRLSSIWANPRKRRRFDLIIVAVMALIVVITGVCAAFMAGPGIPLMSFMYGLSFERYRTLALLMVVAGGVTAAIDFIYAIITVLRHAGDVTKIYLICFAVSVVLPVILIKLLGLMGAVVSYHHGPTPGAADYRVPPHPPTHREGPESVRRLISCPGHRNLRWNRPGWGLVEDNMHHVKLSE